MASPAPPPDSTDLSSSPLVPAETVAFEIPNELSAATMPGRVVSPTELALDVWKTIALNAKLLYAWRMNGVQPELGSKPALEWVVPRGTNFRRPEQLEAYVDSSLSYTSETANYVDSGFDDQSVSIGYAFCAASFKRARNERRARILGTKTLYATGVWRYPRAMVFLDECTQPSKSLIKAVEHALKTEDPARALHQVFDEYGHATPRAVLLGGQLWFTHRRTETERVDEEGVTNKIRAGVSALFGGAHASGGAGRTSSTNDIETMERVTENASWKGRGGDTRLTNSPPDWAATLNDPQLWAVIVNVDAQPTAERLPPALLEQVQRYWRSPAIADPVERESIIVTSEVTGFFVGTRDCGFGDRGSVRLVSGRVTRNRTGSPDASAGAGTGAHWYPDHDVHHRRMSVSVPVRAGDRYGSFFADTWGEPRRRLWFIQCDVALGPWQAWEVAEGGSVVPKDDGFLLVSIVANEHGCRGRVAVSVAGQRLAGAAVHWYEPHDNTFPSKDSAFQSRQNRR